MDAKSLMRFGLPTAVVVLIWAVLGWWVPSGAVADADDRAAAATTAAAQVTAERVRAETTTDYQADLRAQMDLFDVAIPDEIDADGVLRTLDALAAQSGVQLTEVTLSLDDATDSATPSVGQQLGLDASNAGSADTSSNLPTEGELAVPDAAAPTGGTTEGPETLALNLQLRGDYTLVLDFLDRLYQSERLFSIDSLTMSPDNASPRWVSVDVKVRTYAKSGAGS